MSNPRPGGLGQVLFALLVILTASAWLELPHVSTTAHTQDRGQHGAVPTSPGTPLHDHSGAEHHHEDRLDGALSSPASPLFQRDAGFQVAALAEDPPLNPFQEVPTPIPILA